ncbi:MAG: hypothetical protein H8D23_20220, partial [Candidatus Brocadiales bacterium]|nr:hypothetical protein [Candidatus Brocadiales bacterium]
NKGRQLFGGGNIGYKVRTIVFDPDRCSDELNTLKQILGCDYIIICSMAQGMSRISDLVLGETRGVIQFIEPRIDDIESWNYYYAHLPANVTARTFESKETTYARLVDLNRAIIPKIIASDISDMLKGQNVGVVTKPFPVARVDLGDDDIIFVYYSPSGVKSNLDRSPTAMTVIAEGLSPDEIIGEYDVGRQVVPGIRGHLYNLGDGEHAISQISGYRVIPSIDEKNNYYYVPNISFDKY